MSTWDKNYIDQNNYAKSNPNYLKSMFGRTDLMPLWIADMDFKVANPITDEIKRLAERGNFSYEFNSEEVFEAISSWNKRRNDLELNPKSFIQVPGVLTGIALLIRELTNEGDGVLVQTPVYHQFFKLIKTANRTIVENPLKVIDGKYRTDFDDLEKKFKAEKIKTMILCNPHNPVGRVWNKEELQKLVDISNQYGVTIISDEIHSDIVYKPAKFNSIVSLDNSQKHIAVLGSPAKAFGMHSIANGYVYIADPEVHSQLKSTVESMYLDHGNIISSNATLAAYNKSEDWINEVINYMGETINWVESYIEKELPEIKMYKPEGTYQIWLDFSALNLSTQKLNELIVNQAKLALTPGVWFGGDHQQFRRINIASPIETIQKAFTQLKNAMNQDVVNCDTDGSSNTSCCC